MANFLGDKRFLWSTIALGIGIVALAGGITTPSSLGIAGAVIILGVLAYRSAKRRKLNMVEATTTRKTMEIVALVVAFLIVFLQTDIQRLMYEDPFPNLIIPLWVFGAYLYISFSKK